MFNTYIAFQQVTKELWYSIHLPGFRRKYSHDIVVLGEHKPKIHDCALAALKIYMSKVERPTYL